MPGSLQQRLKFFCLTHQEPCVVERTNPLPLCEQGHALSEDFLHDKWEYCCGCESFFKRNDHEAARNHCPSCDRAILARYLCQSCDTLSFDTELPPPQRGFSFSAAGEPQPTCPCCLAGVPVQLNKHDCDEGLRASFKTARQQCPFCGKSISSAGMPTHPLTEELAHTRVNQETTALTFPSTFRRPVGEYLQRMNGKAIIAKLLSYQHNVLTENKDGHFWLQKHQGDDTFIVFPGTSRFSAAQDIAHFQTVFDCAHPGAGELVITAPAVAYLNQTTRMWTVTQKGKLEVIADPSPALKQSVMIPPLDDGIPASNGKVAHNRRHPLLIGGGALVLILAAVAIYYFFASPRSKIVSRVKQGQIVTPAGNSAYDLFLASNLSDSDRAALRQEIVPLLEANGNEVIRKLVIENYAPSAADSDNTAKVYAWLDALTSQNSHRARKHYFQGRAAYDRRDFNGAENEFRQAMTLDPGWALPVNHMGRIALQRRDYVGAQTWYQRAINIDPTFTAPHSNLCVVAVENTRNYSLGAQACRAYIQLDQNKPAGYYFLGNALYGQGYKCDALREYRMALEKAAGAPNIGFNLGRLNKRISQLVNQCGG